MSVATPVIDHLDLVEKEIYLLAGVREYHPVEDIYMEIRNLRRTNEALRVVDMPVKAFGNVPKGGGKFTPRYAVFYDGWKVVPEDISHTLTVTGEQITDDGQSGEACIFFGDLTPGNSVFVNYYPPAAEIVRDTTSLAAIAHMSFNNEIWHDHQLGFTKAEHAANGGDPNLLGNSQYPSSDHAETLEIAIAKKIKRLRYTGPHNLVDNVDLSGYQVYGQSAVHDTLIIGDLPNVSEVEFKNLTLSGVLDGGNIIRDSLVNGLTFFNGIAHETAFTQTPIVLGGGGKTAMILDCYSAVAGGNARPQIDFNGADTNLAIRGWAGGLELVNKTNAIGDVSIDLNSGKLYIRSSCTAGEITVRGIGVLVDESGPGCDVKCDGLINPKAIHLMKQLLANKAVISSDGLTVTIYDDDGVTPAYTFNVSADSKTRTPA